MQKLIKSPLFYINLILLVAFFLLITSINVNQTNLPSFLKKAIAAVQAITGEGGVGYLSAFTATNQIGNSIIYDTGTSIGIGTTSPDEKAKLTVVGTLVGNVASLFWKGEGVSAVGSLGFGSASDYGTSVDNVLIGATATSNSNLILRTGGNNRIFISSGGNVGVGTITPSMKLTVSGGVLADKNVYVQSPLNTNIIVGTGEYQTAKTDWPGKTIYGIGWNSTGGQIGAMIPNGSTFGIYGDGGPAKLEVTGTIKTQSGNISIGERYTAPAPAVISDGTNMGIKTNGSFYVLDSSGNAFKNVQANDYWINTSNKWASQLGNRAWLTLSWCANVAADPCPGSWTFYGDFNSGTCDENGGDRRYGRFSRLCYKDL